MGRANTTARPESAPRGVSVCDLEVLDAQRENIGKDHVWEREFLWLTGDVDVRAGEPAEAILARRGGGRRCGPVDRAAAIEGFDLVVVVHVREEP